MSIKEEDDSFCEVVGDSGRVSRSAQGMGAFGAEEFHWQRYMAVCLGRVPAPIQNLISGFIKTGAAHNIT